MLENLRKLREQTGITQKALAEAIGVSQQSINKYENHNIEPDIETLSRIADHFSTSIDYLVGHAPVHGYQDAFLSESLNADEKKLIFGYQKLTAKQKQAVHMTVEAFIKE